MNGARRFSEITKGRKQGQEDASSHYRKGVAGDWKLHFTPALKDAFKQKYPGMLERLGYEDDDQW